jgi:hypothetical protein
MNKKATSFLYAIIIATLLMNIPTLQTYAAPGPKIFVQPKLNMFTTDVTSVGDTFNVSVSVADFVEPGLYAYEFKLYYDKTLLEATAWALPEGHFLTPAAGEMAVYTVPASGIYQDDGYVLVAISSQGDVKKPKVGSGVLATITFKITKAPPAAQKLSCKLELKDVVMADPDIKDIPVTKEDGYYEFSPPRPSVYLSVDPPIVGALNVGDEFSVDIMINKVEKGIKLIGVQWKLHYNTTLLETSEELITEGDFFKKQLPGPEYETYFWATVEDDYAISFTIYTKMPAPPEIFPEGSGKLATIKFKAKYKPETGKATCDLILDENFVMLIDVDENVIPYHHLENGVYSIPIKLGDLNFDGKVDILDIGIFGKAYGSYPGHPRWNSLADVVRDKVINILDVVMIAKNFGK